MSRIKSVALAFSTVVCALAIGVFMQYGQTPKTLSLADGNVSINAVIPTSSGTGAPVRPAKAAPTAVLAGLGDPAKPATSLRPAVPLPQQPAEVATGTECDVSLTASPTVGAMANLSLRAPCLAQSVVTLHHNGLAFSEMTDANGALDLSVPVLSAEAIFIAAFENGDGAVAQLALPELASFRRVVVQWEGETGLQLHALEFGANYFQDGHVWAQSQGLPGQTESGFMVTLGDPSLPMARLAEVYSFPVGLTTRQGNVNLSVEAEITEANCGTHVRAEILDMIPGTDAEMQDLDLDLPDCGAVGQFLVLKNMFEDLKVASN